VRKLWAKQILVKIECVNLKEGHEGLKDSLKGPPATPQQESTKVSILCHSFSAFLSILNFPLFDVAANRHFHRCLR